MRTTIKRLTWVSGVAFLLAIGAASAVARSGADEPRAMPSARALATAEKEPSALEARNKCPICDSRCCSGGG